MAQEQEFAKNPWMMLMLLLEGLTLRTAALELHSPVKWWPLANVAA